MSVLVIRKHSRFAVCRKARVHVASGKPTECLLVELSLDGCRIGNCDAADFAPGDVTTVEIDGCDPFSGEVRWLGDKSVGLRLTQPFHTYELDSLVSLCRGGTDNVALRA